MPDQSQERDEPERWTLEGSPYGFNSPLVRAGRPLSPGEVVEVVLAPSGETK